MFKNIFFFLWIKQLTSAMVHSLIHPTLNKSFCGENFMVSQYQANHYYICCRGLAGWEVRSGHVKLVYKNNIPPGYLLTRANDHN